MWGGDGTHSSGSSQVGLGFDISLGPLVFPEGDTVSQSARDTWRVHLGILLLCHPPSRPLESLADPPLTPVGTAASGQQSFRFAVCFLLSLLLGLTRLSNKDFSLSVPSQGCPYLQPSWPAVPVLPQ